MSATIRPSAWADRLYNAGVSGAPLCVVCRRGTVDPRWTPFCSLRCRNEDLARWVSGDYRVPGEPALDDALPDDGADG